DAQDTVAVDVHDPGCVARHDDLVPGVVRDANATDLAGRIDVQSAVLNVEPLVADCILQVEQTPVARDSVESEQNYHRVNIAPEQRCGGLQLEAFALQETQDGSADAIYRDVREELSGADECEVRWRTDAARECVLETIIGARCARCAIIVNEVRRDVTIGGH